MALPTRPIRGCSPVSDSFTALGPADAIPPGKMGDFHVGGHSILVANVEGVFYAIEDRCTHDDGPLAEGRVIARRCEVECPRHGARFDLKTGKATALPAFAPVAAYAVRVNEGGMIEVELSADPPKPRFEDPRGTFTLGT